MPLSCDLSLDVASRQRLSICCAAGLQWQILTKTPNEEANYRTLLTLKQGAIPKETHLLPRVTEWRGVADFDSLFCVITDWDDGGDPEVTVVPCRLVPLSCQRRL